MGLIKLFKKEKIDKSKVYCGRCKHFRFSNDGMFFQEKCQHPDNKKFKDTYKGVEEITRHLFMINKNNDCDWYQLNEAL